MHVSDRSSLGQQIQALRILRDMTQETLASAAGISPSYLRKIEKGNANPSLDIIQRLATKLDVALHIKLEIALGHSSQRSR